MPGPETCQSSAVPGFRSSSRASASGILTVLSADRCHGGKMPSGEGSSRHKSVASNWHGARGGKWGSMARPLSRSAGFPTGCIAGFLVGRAWGISTRILRLGNAGSGDPAWGRAGNIVGRVPSCGGVSPFPSGCEAANSSARDLSEVQRLGKSAPPANSCLGVKVEWAMRSRSKNDQRCSGRSGERTGGWGQPGVQKTIPRQGVIRICFRRARPY